MSEYLLWSKKKKTTKQKRCKDKRIHTVITKQHQICAHAIGSPRKSIGGILWPDFCSVSSFMYFFASPGVSLGLFQRVDYLHSCCALSAGECSYEKTKAETGDKTCVLLFFVFGNAAGFFRLPNFSHSYIGWVFPKPPNCLVNLSCLPGQWETKSETYYISVQRKTKRKFLIDFVRPLPGSKSRTRSPAKPDGVSSSRLNDATFSIKHDCSEKELTSERNIPQPEPTYNSTICASLCYCWRRFALVRIRLWVIIKLFTEDQLCNPRHRKGYCTMCPLSYRL